LRPMTPEGTPIIGRGRLEICISIPARDIWADDIAVGAHHRRSDRRQTPAIPRRRRSADDKAKSCAKTPTGIANQSPGACASHLNGYCIRCRSVCTIKVETRSIACHEASLSGMTIPGQTRD
jgi:hypothetical protein